MTPTGKPDDEHEAERPDPGQPAQAPPPPRWLDGQDAPSGPLLPGGGPAQALPPEPPAQPPAQPPAEPPAEPEAEAGPPPAGEGAGAVGPGVADRTVLEFRFEQDDEAKPAPAAPSAPAPAPATSTDIPGPPPFPYAQQPPAPPAPMPPAPVPAPQPPAAQPPAVQPPPVQPPAAQPPPSQSPPAHEPFPFAQEIPSTPARPAPEPFPYAQEVPGTPAPPAPEPFPYAQEIPGAQSSPPAAEPFPWAQQIPAASAQPAPEAARPAAPPPVIEEPWRTTQSAPAKPRRSFKKPLLIGAAGLAAVALVAAAVLVVPGLLDGEEEAGGGSAKLAGAVFPVDGAAPTDGRDQQITGVAAVGSTVVAVGGETDPQNARGLFLVSGDGGRTFESVPQESTDGGVAPPGGVPEAVGASPRGWVAIGSRAGGAGAVWTSENGREWRRQPDAVGDVFGPNDRVTRIAGTRSGFMAIGEYSRKGDFSDAQRAMWLSSDGRRWEARIGDQTGLRVEKSSLSFVEAAASGDVILLQGLVTPSSRKPGPYRKVWRSQDGGRTWAVSEVPVPKGSRGLMIGGGAAGFVAMREVTVSGRAAGQAFLSKDGRSWSKGGVLAPGGYRGTSGFAVDGDGFTAVVTRDGDTLLSRSADGRSWRNAGSAEAKPGREILDAAAAGGQAVLVGREPGGGDTNAVLGVWDANGTEVPIDLAKIPGAVRRDHSVRSVTATGDLAVAVGSASGDAAVWSSQDGGTWKPAQGLGAAFTRPGSQQLTDVAAGTSGWVAVGYDQAAARRPLVVTSADGATWQAADSAAAFAADKTGQPVTYAAAAGERGYVVIGTQGYSVATWFSADLKNWERGTGADPKQMTGGKDDPRWMLDVATGSFGFAAVGGSRDAKGNHPSVWMSSDGKKWTLQQLPVPSGATEAHLTHVAAKDGAIVAAGIAAMPKGLDRFGYISTDAGKTWRPVTLPGGDTAVTVTALAATSGGFAATGTTGRPGAADVVSWTSADGVTWKSATPGGTGLGGVGDQQITGLAPFKGTLLGVGRSADGNGDQPVLWSRPS
ncbi:hypothetical protein SAMN05443665_1021111 [Actinomadura meyerae]|uniref:Uncharacterized protein n=1 Tax=Actinomadura meyerae TaxID=240840 RepID=A0A239L908_9ACTN|nr:sialidase family protein [Actinomadura meyerae]SNT27096.1 hypothetical protein SAMN05443665_1021111 [Actinomadura meyerae]